ncbi:MAG: hypothetical protein HQM03_01545 [Magnetococcales bacterium]|nr:hypothetical protein [Magnetococcales bacterium]
MIHLNKLPWRDSWSTPIAVTMLACLFVLISSSGYAEVNPSVPADTSKIIEKYATLLSYVEVLARCGKEADAEQLRTFVASSIARDFPETKTSDAANTYAQGFLRGMRHIMDGASGYATMSISPSSCKVLRLEMQDMMQKDSTNNR